jgi:hypothetical protein
MAVFPHRRKNRARTPSSPRPATVSQASLLARGPSPRCGDAVLPQPSTRAPPEIATTGRIGAEKERAAANPPHHLPRSRTTSGELPTSSRSCGEESLRISSTVEQARALPERSQWRHRVQSTPASTLSGEEGLTVHQAMCDPD